MNQRRQFHAKRHTPNVDSALRESFAKSAPRLAPSWQREASLDQREIECGQLLAGALDSYSIEERYLRKDNTYLWVDVTVSLVRNLQTQASDYLIAVIQDISGRKHFEQELQVVTKSMLSVGLFSLTFPFFSFSKNSIVFGCPCSDALTN